MSTGAVKGIEVLLIAGVVFWFAYSQLNALKQSKPTDKDNAASATEGQNTEKSEGGSSATRSQGND
jgi:hypothetical protein